MLARLEYALGCTDLMSQMVLVPHHPSSVPPAESHEINLVVGYNHSSGSQTALDLTLWIAHQTRLATRKQVTVQVVYVIDRPTVVSATPGWVGAGIALEGHPHWLGRSPEFAADLGRSLASQRTCTTTLPATGLVHPIPSRPELCQLEQFEQADRILWHARRLADEWRGSLKTHLRFGNVADELRAVALAESADLLLLGCTSARNSIVQALGTHLPCPVLGIPSNQTLEPNL